MLANVLLTRPLAILDLETTGLNVHTDRIVEIGILKVYPDGHRKKLLERVNPGVPIPYRASNVHHILDKDVKGLPGFSSLCAKVRKCLLGCDWCGFNLKEYDLPLLECEFARHGEGLQISKYPYVVDVMKLYHSFHECSFIRKRDLSSAVRFYCGVEHTKAHGALDDCRATGRVLNEMIDYHELSQGLLCSVEELCGKVVVR